MSAFRASPMGYLTIALGVVAVVTLSPLLVPVVLAAWTAQLARPLLERVARGLKGRHRAAAVLITAMVLLLFTPLSFLLTALVSGASELYTLFTTSEGAPSALKALVSPGSQPDSPWVLPQSTEQVLELAQKHGAQVFQLLGGIAGAAAKVVIGLLVFFFGAYTFLIEGPAMWAWLVRRTPLAPGHLKRLAAAFHETGRGLLIGVGLTSLTQATAAVVIYLALGIPRALVLGLVTGLAAFVPIVGAALVWGPVTAGLFLTGHPVKALIMGIGGLVVISGMDNVMRPIFSRYGQLELPVFVLFLSVFGGLVIYGPFGAMLGPLVVRLTKEALTVWSAEREIGSSAAPGG
jgi:predicted PurR-regulated permease PerM